MIKRHSTCLKLQKRAYRSVECALSSNVCLINTTEETFFEIRMDGE